MALFEDERSIEDLVRRIESCALPPDAWGHNEHIVLACWQLWRHDREEATRRIRETLVRYNAAHHAEESLRRGYHETITLAWIAVLCPFLTERKRSDVGLTDATRDALARFPNKRELLRHYSEARIMSWEAKREWVEPDLEPFA